MKTRTLVAACCVTLAVSQIADAAVIRDHYLVAERNRHRVYEVTRIHDQGATLVTRTFLIADTNGPFARVDVVTDYGRNKALTTYKLLRGSGAGGDDHGRSPVHDPHSVRTPR